MSGPRRIVVVGAGLAGLRTVQELRGRGHDGELVLVGAEPHRPYDRPPLSKELLLASAEEPATPTLEADWDALDVRLQLATTATGLGDGIVATTAGEVPFDAVVVATGSVPRRVAGERALVLRTVEDARVLRAALVPGARVAVVGAGWIGAEVATAAAAAGCRTTVVEAAPAPLAGALPLEVGALTVPWYAESRIDLVLGCAVVAVEPSGGAHRVRLADGGVIEADVVVEGVGVRPATDWLADSGLDLHASGAVRTDAGLRANRPGVWAVGDAAAWESRRYGRVVHSEHWDDALHAPEVVAASVLGDPGAAYDPVPYVWSEQLGHYVQYAGAHQGASDLVHRGKPGDPGGWTLCWVDRVGDASGTAGRLRAVLAVDRPRDVVQGRRLAASGALIDLDLLADPSTALRAAARSDV